MLVSLFKSVGDVFPEPMETTWPDFLAALQPHLELADKSQASLFAPAEWSKGSTRTKKGVVRVHFAVFDLDKVPDAKMTQLIDEIIPQNWAYALYTTHSHTKYQKSGLWAARLLLPFSRPVLAAEWLSVWKKLHQKLGSLADPACKDPCRIYYVPSVPDTNPDDAIFMVQHGELIDVDDILSGFTPANLEVATAHTKIISRAQLIEFTKGLKRRKSPYYADIAAKMKSVLVGQPFAEPGERDTTIFQLVSALVDEFPDADASKLADFFNDSLREMASISAFNDDGNARVVEKIQRLQMQRVEEAHEQERETIALKKRAIQAAFPLTTREHPYTEEELDAFAAEAKCSRATFLKRWIIQKDGTFYFFKGGSYTNAYTIREMVSAALLELAPAESAGVALRKINDRGKPANKTQQELVDDYGIVAQNVIADLTCQKSYFDASTGTIVEACCPLRELAPMYNPQVAKWLALLGGEKYEEKILDWLAVATLLDEPCAALYLEGHKGAGKTLFASGVARLWTTKGPTTLEEAISSFNSLMTSCPLVLADEMVPTDLHGATRTAELRQFIQARERPLTRKFMPASTLKGCIRLIITANNKEVLTSNKFLSAHDIDAIVDRILYVSTTRESYEYLCSLSPEEKSAFVQGDGIAKHALWLRDNRQVTRGHRFIVDGDKSELHRALTISSGLRSSVCNWLVAYLLAPQKVDSQKTLLVRRTGGKLYATSRALAKYWDVYETNADAPQAGPISKALAGLGTRKRQFVAGDGKRTNFWELDNENLIAWAEDNGYADRETIEEILEKGDGHVDQEIANAPN